MIIRNARLLPELTDGYSSSMGDIIIEGNRIAAITEPGKRPPCHAEFNAAGRTVLPGLIDIHLHFSVSGKDVLVDNFQPTPVRTLEAYRFALDTLRAGFTTVRDVGDVKNIAVALRDEIEAGRLIGPRIKAAAAILTPTEAGNDYFAEMYDECNSVDEVRAACRRQLSAGGDFIKVMASGAISNPSGQPGMTIETEEEVREMVRCAKQHNTYVAAHCHGADSIEMCLRAGVYTIEHATILSEWALEELKKGQSYMIPTLACAEKIHGTTAGFADYMAKKEGELLEQRNHWIKRAYQEGLKMGFGTDCGTTDNWHGTNADELIARVEIAGMAPIDTLLQATRNSAEIMGLDHDIGSIAAGKFADLVIVDGEPEKDIHCVRNHVYAVFKDGVFVH